VLHGWSEIGFDQSFLVVEVGVMMCVLTFVKVMCVLKIGGKVEFQLGYKLRIHMGWIFVKMVWVVFEELVQFERVIGLYFSNKIRLKNYTLF